MSALKLRLPLVPLALMLAGVFAASAAHAATPTPQSSTTCAGGLARDSSGGSDEPNLLDYKFYCDGDITAYTLIVNRRTNDWLNIDDFSPNADVLQGDGSVSATESFTCAGTVPGNGVNCNAGAGGVMSASYAASGSIDPILPFCRHFGPHPKPGSRPIPQALVQVVVTNTTGAQDGPFQLNLSPACPKVPDVYPKPKAKAKSEDKTKHKVKARKHSS